MRLGRSIVWVAVALVLLGLGLALVNSFKTQVDEGIAPDFTLTTFDNQTVKLSDLRGQVVVINFWASWCVPCEGEAPDLEAAYQASKDRGVVFIGVAYVDADEKSKAFIEKYGVTYLNGPDLGTRISDDYRVRAVPETYIVDKTGQLSFIAKRVVTHDELMVAIEAALQAGS